MKITCTSTRLITLCLFTFFSKFLIAQNCTANAGLDQTICVTQPMVLTGTPGSPQAATPAYLWTQVSGPAAVITTPTATTTTVTGFTPGNYVFQFSNKCIDNLYATNLVSITVLPEPPTAQAGTDVANCTNSPVTLSANAVGAPFTGTWTVSPPAGTFSPNANTANAVFTPPAGTNTYTLTWTISNGSCVTSATKIVKVVVPANTVSAGTTQTISCNGNCATLAGSFPGIAPPQNGLWTVVSGPSTPVFSNPNSNTSTACNLVPGTYVLRWTVTGPCQTGSADVTINVTNIFTAPNAGSATSYTTFCGTPTVTSQVLTGAALAAGETAVWTQTGGGTGGYPNVTFVPGTTGSNVTVTGLTGPFPYTFRYTKTNTAGCSANVIHTVYRAPVIQNLSEPPNKELACDVQSTTFTLTYDDLTNVTNGLTRAGTRITGPSTVGSVAYTTSTATGGIRTDTWTASGMTLAGTYIYRLEYRNSCGSFFRDIAITVSRTPGTVNAGSSPVLPCNTLFANPIGSATAPTNLTWIQLSGPNTATLSGVNSLSLTMTGLDAGVYKMRLTNSGGMACPNSTSDVLVKVTRAAPTVATTGANATICAGRYRLTANTPGPLETGTWTVTPSTGITFSPNANTPNAFVSGLAANTAYTFTWTMSNSCGNIASSQVLTTTNSQAPPIPNAGVDICRPSGSTNATLSGSAPSSANILWTALTAGSSVSPVNTQATTATFTGGSGTYLFEYALNTTGCSTFTDTVAVTVNSIIAAPNAGTNQDLCVATVPASTTLTATPAPPAGSVAIWSQLGGPSAATIASPNTPSTTVGNLIAGIYEFEYRIQTGACSDLVSTVDVRVAQEPSNAVAGPNQSICSATTSTAITLAATPPAVGSGYWQVISGPAGGGTPTFSNQNLATSTISGLTQGTYTLRWTTFNGPSCDAKTSDMTIDVTATANAGAAIPLCDKTSTNLTGNPNTTGTWSQVSGPGGATITTNSPNTAVVTGLISSVAGTAYTFRYTLPAVGACPSSFSDVVVTNYTAPSAAIAPADRQICFSTTSATITGNIPTAGTGSWARISGPNTPTAGTANANYADTTLNNLIAGVYIYEYRVTTNASCVSSAARTQIIKEVTANALPNQRLCNATSVTLTGNSPIINQGTWSYISGPAGYSITNVNNPTTTVTGLVPGIYVFRWTIASPDELGCAANSSDVQIIIDPPVPALFAGTDQSFCEGSVSSFTIGAPAQGGVSYTWFPTTLLNDATIAQPTFTGVNNAGTYIYTVKGNIGSCEAYSTVNITVNPKPGANIDITSGVCAATFAATDVGNGVKSPTYSWNFGAAGDAVPNTATGPGPINVTFNINSTKSITLNVSSADGCTNSKTITYVMNCTLPIKLVSFNAVWKNNVAFLQWKVADAIDFAGFGIQRSYDGVNYTDIGNVPYSTGNNIFSYEDQTVNIAAGKVYYRLKLINKNNAYTLSDTRVLTANLQGNVVISPNPFTDKITIRFTNSISVKNAQVRLLNSIGQTIIIQQGAVNLTNQTLQIEHLGNISVGIYTIQIIADGKSSFYKVLKQ